MKVLLCVFLCTVLASKDPAAPGITVVKPADCGNGETFSREQAWVCIENVVDTNNDKRISAEEMEQAEKNYIPTWKRYILKAASWFVEAIRVSRIMKDCDQDNDGYITLDDYATSHDLGWCMPYMNPDKQWKEPSPALCYMKQLCDNAASKLRKKVY